MPDDAERFRVELGADAADDPLVGHLPLLIDDELDDDGALDALGARGLWVPDFLLESFEPAYEFGRIVDYSVDIRVLGPGGESEEEYEEGKKTGQHGVYR